MTPPTDRAAGIDRAAKESPPGLPGLTGDLPRDLPRDAGSATVWTAVWALLPAFLACVALMFGAAVATRHRAAAAADAAALAAASHADLGFTEACNAARRITRAHDTTLTTCTVRSGFADVVVEARPPPLLSLYGPARALARAGPR